jgi:hypothetical protein
MQGRAIGRIREAVAMLGAEAGGERDPAKARRLREALALLWAAMDTIDDVPGEVIVPDGGADHGDDEYQPYATDEQRPEPERKVRP